MFNPRTQYDVLPKKTPITDFTELSEEFVVRPPYQRKIVWTRKMQQDLLDSLFRRYYIPCIVIRLVRLDEEHTVKEVIDGQQRIVTAQSFLWDKLPLPDTLKDVHPELPGKRYSELPVELKRFVIKQLEYDTDIIKGIDNPKNPEHQKIATEIFWRLQQGESLNYMEIAHSRLSSLSRNFVVKYADDIGFDFQDYKPIDTNPHKHEFFKVIARDNNRMQHLALLTRFLILEEANGPADIKNRNVTEYIDNYQKPDGIDNLSFEKTPQAQNVLKTMRTFYEIFKNDPMVNNGEEGMRELRVEYVIISAYLLLRHLTKYYVFSDKEYELFREFIISFHQRWDERKETEDSGLLVFSDNRQQSAAEIEVRHRIIRQLFFEFASEDNHSILTKDERRHFSEAQRIKIYRRDRGLCQMCLAEGKPEKECVVPWSQYEADHVLPHSKGGPTDTENAQVLCKRHNRLKGPKG